MDGAAIYRRKAEIGLLLLKNRFPNSGYPLCLQRCKGTAPRPSGTRQQQQQYYNVKKNILNNLKILPFRGSIRSKE